MPTERPAQKLATLLGLINMAGLPGLPGGAAVPWHRLELLGTAVTAVMMGRWVGGD